MSGPVFHLEPMGRLANLMIEYMVALKFATMVARLPDLQHQHAGMAD